MKAGTLVLLLAAMAIFVGGCTSQTTNTQQPKNTAQAAGTVQATVAAHANTIEYMGLKYGRSAEPLPSEDLLYYTGQSYNSANIYVPGWTNSTDRVPPLIFTNNGSGFSAYSRLADNPPVYAYALCSAYNTNESVVFGLVDESGGKIELGNSAPWEIQLKTDAGWKPVYHPVSAQRIIPLENGAYKEWTWDQRLDNGSGAPFGDYRVVMNGGYAVQFEIARGSPAVEVRADNYDNQTLYKKFWLAPQYEAFKRAYHGGFINGTYDPDHNYSVGLRDEIISEVLFKAYVNGGDVGKLKKALNTSIGHTSVDVLPCLAVHADYRGRPSWIIVYNWGCGGMDDYYHIRCYAIDDEEGRVSYFETCA